MNKFSKKQLIDTIKNMKPKETNIVRQNGKIEVTAKGDEIEVSSSKEITLKSIYEMVISIKVDVITVKEDVISVKADVNNLDTKVTNLDGKLNNLDNKFIDLDTKLNKVIDLNNLKV